MQNILVNFEDTPVPTETPVSTVETSETPTPVPTDDTSETITNDPGIESTPTSTVDTGSIVEAATEANAAEQQQNDLNNLISKEILGFANKNEWYLVGEDDSSIYVYSIGRYCKFSVSDNVLNFTNCSGIEGVINKTDGTYTVNAVADSINYGSYYGLYSNVEAVNVPSLYELQRGSYENTEEIVSVLVIAAALIIGCIATKRVIDQG